MLCFLDFLLHQMEPLRSMFLSEIRWVRREYDGIVSILRRDASRSHIYIFFVFVFVFECIAAEISIRFERSTCKEIDSCIPIYHVTV